MSKFLNIFFECLDDGTSKESSSLGSEDREEDEEEKMKKCSLHLHIADSFVSFSCVQILLMSFSPSFQYLCAHSQRWRTDNVRLDYISNFVYIFLLSCALFFLSFLSCIYFSLSIAFPISTFKFPNKNALSALFVAFYFVATWSIHSYEDNKLMPFILYFSSDRFRANVSW